MSGSTSVTEDRSLPAPEHRRRPRARADGIDRDHRHLRRRQRGRAAAARRSSPAPRGGATAARSTASGRTASGTPTGRPARTRPTTCSSNLAAACSSAPAPKARSSGVTGDPARATLLSRATARQVTALLRDPRGRVVGATSNPGKLFALSANPAAKGSYESDVRDAGTVASWGVIRWRATARAGQVQLLTRSGNTANPGRDLERVVEALHER